MDKPKADDALERAYQRGVADAMNAHQCPVRLEIWDCATVRLADWVTAHQSSRLPHVAQEQA